MKDFPSQGESVVHISRRDFLGASTAAAGMIAAGGSIAWASVKDEIQTLKDNNWSATPVACNVCGGFCGLLLMQKNGAEPGPDTVRVMPNPDHPQRGYCARGAQAFHVWNHPLRLKKPMKRVGEKGEGKFKEISWDEALQEIADKVKAICDKDGEHAIAFTSHNFSGYQKWLSAPLGTPNQISHSGSCNSSSIMGRKLVFGAGYQGAGKVEPDYANCKMLLCLGRSLNCAIGIQSVVSKARLNGLQVVYVDPRMPQAALSGAQWMPIRPGTDAAFLLGLINYGIQKGYCNMDWLRSYSNGPYLMRSDSMMPLTQADLVQGGDKTLYVALDQQSREPRFLGVKDGKYVGDTNDLEMAFSGEIKLHNGETVPAVSAYEILRSTAEPYTAQRVSELTGIPAKEFEQLCHDFFSKNGVVDDGWYSSKNGNDSHNYALICILNLLGGNFDKKGGFIVTQGGGFGGVKVGTKGVKGSGPQGQSWKLNDGKRLDTVLYPEGAGTISAIYDAIENGKPYPVRGMFITGSTMFHREAHSPSLIKAMKALELLVVQDIFPHEIIDYADYVLPSTYFLETREYTGVKWARDGYVQINDGPLTPPKGNDSREEVWQLCEILRRAYPDRAKDRIGYDHEIKTREEFKKWYDGMFNKAWAKYIAKKNEAKPGDGDRIAKEVAEQGFSLAATKKYEVIPYKKPFDTPTGKAELVSFYIAQKYPNKEMSPVHTYEPSKAWTAPKPNSDEFYLVSGKDASGSCGTTIFTKPAQFVGDRTLWMNVADAQRLGIHSGDLVELTSLDSKEKGRVRVKVTNRVMAGTLFHHGFQGDVRTKHLADAPGYEWIREGLNTNRLCPSYKEPLVGASSNNCTVKVVRI